LGARSTEAGRVPHSQKREYWQLTAEGRSFAAKHPNGIPAELLKQLAFRPTKSHLADGEDDGELVDGDAEETRTPEERLEAAYETRRRVRAELLDVVRQSEPAFFEHLVLDLLHAMGYGANRKALTQVGGAGDGGIDGVISLDKLGLEKVYVQAKRYADDNHVSRPTIQGFFGALAGRRATKGVFITTSRFSKEAREFAASASDSILLIDGLQPPT
jgi:restriction system protein